MPDPLYVVYRYRFRGERLPLEGLPFYGAKGYVRYYTRLWDKRPQFRVMAAQLRMGERYVIPILDRACIRDLALNGRLLISGIEVIPRRQTIKSAVDQYPQTWLCVPADQVKPPEPNPAAARALAAALAGDLDEGDDDDPFAWVRPEHLAKKYPGLKGK